jgi:hypothetical protein
MGSSTVGAAGVGFGLSVGSSWTDDECGIRETARSFDGMGMKSDAIKVLCASKYAAVAPACVSVTPLPANASNCNRDEIIAKRIGVPVCK